AFGQRCREMGVRPSMGSVGDAYDNALCESFFATLECELLDRQRLHTQVEARLAIFEFIEGWYNPHRRHSALGYPSPVHYERSQLPETGPGKPLTAHRTGGSPGAWVCRGARRSDARATPSAARPRPTPRWSPTLGAYGRGEMHNVASPKTRHEPTARGQSV